MKSHALIMLIGCGLPMLLLFILPESGASQEATIVIFILLMMDCHLMHFKHMGQAKKHENDR